ncbi:MAG: TIR domain-containing protein [Panacagrimonas sp.]
MGIRKFERNRTHWAIKDVDLGVVLKQYPLPGWALGTGRPVDIRTHTFDVALSFAGEDREYVREAAKEVTGLLGRDAVFYDENYEAQLARPGIDTLLQGIYRRAKLVVVVLSQHYALKRWCTVEFRAIREIIQSRDHDHIMYVRVDDAPVDGVLPIDGYLDASRYQPSRLAMAIRDRFDLL